MNSSDIRVSLEHAVGATSRLRPDATLPAQRTPSPTICDDLADSAGFRPGNLQKLSGFQRLDRLTNKIPPVCARVYSSPLVGGSAGAGGGGGVAQSGGCRRSRGGGFAPRKDRTADFSKRLLREYPAANNRWLPGRRCPWPDRAGPRRGATRKEANGPRPRRRRHRRNETEERRSGGPSPAVAGLQAR